MPRRIRRISSFIATATLAATVTAFIGWPSHVNADGKAKAATRQQSEVALSANAPENAPLANNEAKVGDLYISADLVPSETTPGGRIIRLECRNPTAQKISGKVMVELTRTRGIAMERVMPQPQIAWRHPESVTVEPGATLTRDIALPKNIGGEVARIDKARERATNSDSVPYPNTYYGVVASPVEPGGARANARDNSRSKLTLAAGPNIDGF